MTTEEAIATVARQALYRAASNIEWGEYPDIGQDDWSRVLDKIDQWSRWIDDGRYGIAYDLLAARANASQEARP